MRILGVDYGEKHIGLAAGDTDMGIATPLREVDAREGIQAIAALCRNEAIGGIVVGLPLSFQMEETGFSRKVRIFGEALRDATGLPVKYENEILTSDQAKRETGAKSHSVAAALILQSYLERK